MGKFLSVRSYAPHIEGVCGSSSIAPLFLNLMSREKCFF